MTSWKPFEIGGINPLLQMRKQIQSTLPNITNSSLGKETQSI